VLNSVFEAFQQEQLRFFSWCSYSSNNDSLLCGMGYRRYSQTSMEQCWLASRNNSFCLNYPIQRRGGHFEMLIVSHLLNLFSAFYETHRFIQKNSAVTYLKPVYSTQYLHLYSFQIHFNIIHAPTRRSRLWSSIHILRLKFFSVFLV
jgi:hypothetical protein